MPGPVVEAIGVQKVFTDFWGRPSTVAVREMSLSIPQGGVFALLGPNGAGKSTFLKLILGQLKVSAGTLRVLGAAPSDVATKSRMGYMPEQPAFWGNLTAYETLAFLGKLQDVPTPWLNERIPQLLAMTGIAHAAHRKTAGFSHGMRKRLALAQTLIHDPDLLILDEPTAGMDPLGCHEVKTLIQTLAKRGKTVLVTSHLLADIQDIADQIAILFGGSILAQGNLRELLAEKNKTEFTFEDLSDDQKTQLENFFVENHFAPEISQPQRSLESYFLDIILQANRTRETSGAAAGGNVAEFLQAVPSIESMVRKAPEAEMAVEVMLDPNLVRDVNAEPEEAPEAKAVDYAALDALTKK